MPETVWSAESITRDGQVVRKPTRPRTTHRSTPSVPPPRTSGPLDTGLAAFLEGVAVPGSPEPARRTGNQPHVRRLILLDTHERAYYIETFVLPCSMYVARLGEFFFYTANIVTKYRVRQRIS